MFRNSPVVEFPSNSAGARFGFAPADIIEADVIAVDADGDWEDVFDAMFIAGQVNFKFKIAGLDGNYRVIGWGNGSNHTRWLNAEKDKEINYGWGLSFDQELTDVLGVFMRYGWQDPKVYTNGSAFSLTHSWSAGPQVKGVLWNRPDDVLGVGIGQILPSKKYKEVNGLKAKPESHLEMYYNFKVNEHFSLSPDLQIIWRPYGKDAVNGDGTIVIGGVRGQMDF
jgi:porin